MISVLFMWLIICVVFYTTGHAFNSIIYRNCKWVKNQPDMHIISGMCFCTVYAQIYSLFDGVRFRAFIFVFFFSILCTFYSLKHKSVKIYEMTQCMLKEPLLVGTIIVAMVGTVLWTSIVPQHYDTYLYHAQAIHWIEEYGVVPGLGNLHFRLAYNSAFMSLQSLFSFCWINGQSFHALNGFFTFLILSFILKSMIKNGSKNITTLSGLLKCGTLIYILYDSFHVSSPNTDTIALLVMYYILIKWADYYEAGEEDIRAYGYLCVLVLFATTLKLSVGVFVLLVIYPAYIMIREKKAYDIIVHMVLGCIVVIPFVFRNIIVSGYLIYPYEFTGIASMDWKMPERILQSDKAEIVAWGRGTLNVSRNEEHIWEWIGQWYGSINIVWKIMIFFTILSLIYLLIEAIRNKRKFRISAEWCLYCVCLIGLCFWMFTAPLPRYGTIYMISIPCLALATCIKKHLSIRKDLDMVVIRAIKKICIVASISYCVLYLFLFLGYIFIMKIEFPDMLYQGEYANKETYIVSDLGVDIAVPIEGDQTGYNPFPSMPYSGGTKGIILRGEDLRDGFKAEKIKE